MKISQIAASLPMPANGSTRRALLSIAAIGALAAIGVSHRPAFVAAAPLANRTTAVDAKARHIQNTLERFLNNKVTSPGGKMTLRITPSARTAQGYFSVILVGGKPAQVKDLRISEIMLHAINVHIDVNALLYRNDLRTIASNTKLRAVISEDDLTALLARGKHSRSMGLVVKYVGDKIHVSGNLQWAWINGPVTGIGKLRLAPGHKVYFDILSLKLNGGEVPDWLKAKFSERINPVITYDDIPFRPVFKSLTFKGNVAILTA